MLCVRFSSETLKKTSNPVIKTKLIFSWKFSNGFKFQSYQFSTRLHGEILPIACKNFEINKYFKVKTRVESFGRSGIVSKQIIVISQLWYSESQNILCWINQSIYTTIYLYNTCYKIIIVLTITLEYVMVRLFIFIYAIKYKCVVRMCYKRYN